MMLAVAENKSDYLFLVGKIRVLENQMIDRFGFYRLADNSSVEGFLSDLSDSPYKDYVGADDLGYALKEYVYKQYSYLKKKMDSPVYLDLFMMGGDISNIISFIKQADSDAEYVPGIMPVGWWEKEALPEFVKKVQYKLQKISSSTELARVSAAAVESVSSDVICETVIGHVKNQRIRDYWGKLIDIKNYFLNRNGTSESNYLAGGSISKNFWKKLDLSGEIPAKLAAQPFFRTFEKTGNIAEAESAARKYMGTLIKEMRKTPFGPEPLTAYLLGIIEETANLMHIYTGISMGFEPNEIKEGVNLAYV